MGDLADPSAHSAACAAFLQAVCPRVRYWPPLRCSSVAAARNTALKLCGPHSSFLGAYRHTPHCELEPTSDSVASRTLVALLSIHLPVKSSSSIRDLSIASPSKSRFLSTNHQKCHFLPFRRRVRNQIQLDSGSHDASDPNLH